MTDNFIHHFICVMATLVCLVVYWAGYVSGGLHWWWTVFAVLGVYLIVYHLVDA
jgi:hypothetical protein